MEECEVDTKYWSRYLMGLKHFGNLHTNEKKIKMCLREKSFVRVWAELNCLRTG
jgi:hypothetical protein